MRRRRIELRKGILHEESGADIEEDWNRLISEVDAQEKTLAQTADSEPESVEDESSNESLQLLDESPSARLNFFPPAGSSLTATMPFTRSSKLEQSMNKFYAKRFNQIMKESASPGLKKQGSMRPVYITLDLNNPVFNSSKTQQERESHWLQELAKFQSHLHMQKRDSELEDSKFT